VLILAFFLVTIIFVSGCGKRNTQDTGPEETNGVFTLSSGDHEFTFIHDGLTRKYLVHVPSSYDKEKETPLVLGLHGGGGNADVFQNKTSMNDTSDKEDFIVAYPEGVGERFLGKMFASWSVGICCPAHDPQVFDDVGFISKVIKDMSTKFNIDKKRVYATGHSNGAMLSYRLACELSNEIAAIAPVGAVLPFEGIDECKPERVVPIMHIHGTDDPCALYNGGQCGGCFDKIVGKDPTLNLWACDGVEEYFDKWKVINNNNEEGTIVFENGIASCEAFGNTMQLCSLDGMGHAWPGGNFGACENPNSNTCKLVKSIMGAQSNDLIANETIWGFFKEHSLN